MYYLILKFNDDFTYFRFWTGTIDTSGTKPTATGISCGTAPLNH